VVERLIAAKPAPATTPAAVPSKRRPSSATATAFQAFATSRPAWIAATFAPPTPISSA
jgi:hypothetical protein